MAAKRLQRRLKTRATSGFTSCRGDTVHADDNGALPRSRRPSRSRSTASRPQLGGARQRTVLAVLLMHANEPVATDRLVSESWGENAPASATKTAQVYVSRLRGALGNDTLTATPGGYLLGVAPGALDTDELEELRARAREADPREAGRLLRQGLALWRGPPYADLRYEEALQTEIRRLEELRLATLEERIEADLAAGEASQLVGRARSAGRGAPSSRAVARVPDACALPLRPPGRGPRDVPAGPTTPRQRARSRARARAEGTGARDPRPRPRARRPPTSNSADGAATLRRTPGRRRGAAARGRPDRRLPRPRPWR